MRSGYCRCSKLQKKYVGKHVFYAPNFQEVEEAYWFGPVRLSVHPSVCYTCTRSGTVRDRILKFGMWDEYEN